MAALLLAAFLCLAPAAAADTMERVSVSSAGVQTNDNSDYSDISANGDYVAFESYASNLVADDGNNYQDVFVRDRQTGETTRVSVSSDGGEANDESSYPHISADGRYVVFATRASNLVPGDGNDVADIFVHDRQTGETTRVSVSSDGEEANYRSSTPRISADGRYVVFASYASNLVAGDSNNRKDVFIHDRQSGQTTLVSVSSDGQQGNDDTHAPCVSVGGRYVAFYSYATNLVDGAGGSFASVFVHDRRTGETTLASATLDGGASDGDSQSPVISADGRYVAFESRASNLVAGVSDNTRRYLYVHDRETGQITMVSVSSDGEKANADSYYPRLSGDGRYVAFLSYASNLVTGDGNGEPDIFVHDLQTGQTILVSVSLDSGTSNWDANRPAISANGRFVTFRSRASDLVAGDDNGRADIFGRELSAVCAPAIDPASASVEFSGGAGSVNITGDAGCGWTATTEETWLHITGGASGDGDGTLTWSADANPTYQQRSGVIFIAGHFFTVTQAPVPISIDRVSVASDGAEANDYSYDSAISANGDYVAFESDATDLVAGDGNDATDIFVHDRETGETTRVSVSSDGEEANGDSTAPFISADGRYVVFASAASNLVAGDGNNRIDIFVHDRETGETTRVSVSSDGEEGNSGSSAPHISADGHYVVFGSFASNLVAGDTNGKGDVFIHDRQTGETTRVSVNSAGQQSNDYALSPKVSVGGRYVAFQSSADNLAEGADGSFTKIFVHDRQTGETNLASVTLDGGASDGHSQSPDISADGRYVAFESYASNLVDGVSVTTRQYVYVHDRETGQTTMVSVSSDGEMANANSYHPSLSGDGRYVTFYSDASNLWDGASGSLANVFVHDRETGRTAMVSVSPDGEPGNSYSVAPNISTDGRYVVFRSFASDLVDGDGNGSPDIFVHELAEVCAHAIDPASAHVTHAGGAGSVNVTGDAGCGWTATTEETWLHITGGASGDGDGTLTWSADVNPDIVQRVGAIIVAGHIFTVTQAAFPTHTELVTISLEGVQPEEGAEAASISADGRYVAFHSWAGDLVEGDDSELILDVFVHDRATGQISLVSRSSAGEKGDSPSGEPCISMDGRYVAFHSQAANLVAGDGNNAQDIFIHDRETGQTTRVSVSSDGQEGDGDSGEPSISLDGRYVAFQSRAGNLVADDENGGDDIFVHDRETGQTTRVSVTSDGEEGIYSSSYPSISADGRYVAFHSSAYDLVPGDNNGRDDIFVHDRATGQTTRVSVASDGGEGNGHSQYPDISADGRYVAFNSRADNLVTGDDNGCDDIFVHDRATGQTIRASVSSDGVQGNAASYGTRASISAGGRYVAFASRASNLVSGDTNGREDVFVHDCETGQTMRVSLSADDEQSGEPSWRPSISADGHYVAFSSSARNFADHETLGAANIYVRSLFLDCVYAVVPAGAGAAHDGGTGVLGVTAGSGCPWAALSYADWLHVTDGINGQGSGTVSWSADANPHPVPRTGTIIISGQTFTVTQEAAPCTYAIDPSSAGAASTGDTGGVSVITHAVCAWTAVPVDSWLHVTAGASGSGDGTVSWSADANPNHAQRTGTITIAGQTFTVTQEASPCAYAIDPAGDSAAFTGDTGSVSVTTDPVCPWTAVPVDSWLHVTAGASGTGNGTVSWSADANPDFIQRTGAITIAGQTFTVTQEPFTMNLERVSVSSAGAQANYYSAHPDISANGDYVAFESYASNLVAGDDNDSGDIFVHDRNTGETTRVSVSSDGQEANGESSQPSISADGRCVVFLSEASNLVAGDGNGDTDVFVHDRQTGQTTRVSVASDGAEANGDSFHSDISSDGRYVVFASDASNLVAGDSNGESDVFIHDRQTGQTSLFSVSSDGQPGNGSSSSPSVSVGGRYVAFHSYATNLVEGAGGTFADVFVRDRQTGETTLASVALDGQARDGISVRPHISDDGRFVAFESQASNLVAGVSGTDRRYLYVHDRATGQTTMVSVSSDGEKAQGNSYRPRLSADGRYVAFYYLGYDLAPEDCHGVYDVFVHDRETGQTTQVSLNWSGMSGNDYSKNPNISADGRFVAFRSLAHDLVAGDSNLSSDIFVCELSEVCAHAIEPASADVTHLGGTGSVDVAGDAGCAWTVSTPDSWLHITDSGSGDGNGTLTWSADANPDHAQRTGNIVVAGHFFTVTQEAAPCVYGLDPASADAAHGGGTGSVSVTVPGGCPWTAAANDSWLQVTAGASGSGSGVVEWSADANPDHAPRSGTLTIAGQTFTVTQEAVPCNFGIDPASASAAQGGDTGSVSVTAEDGCPWTAASNDSWLHVTAGATGSSNGMVEWAADVNPGHTQRMGTLTIADQTFTVTQEALPCTYGIDPSAASAAQGGDTGSVSVTAGDGCPWTATANDSWLLVTAGASGSGNGTVEWAADTNATGQERMGTLTIAGQSFTVTQGCAQAVLLWGPLSLLIGDGDFYRDSDEDGILDGIEMRGCTDPDEADSDGDGIIDGVEDADRDGSRDVGETDPCSYDSDRDGIADGQEDANQNGVKDQGETDPRLRDTDGDGMPDGYEVANGLEPLNDDAALDKDDDGYSNKQECLAGSRADDANSIPRPATLAPVLPLILN